MPARLLLSLIAAVLIAFPAWAGPITVVTEEWPPYSYSEDGEVKGVATDLVRAILDDSGLKYSIAIYPWARAYDMALNNENVLIYSIVRLPSRESLFHWIPLDSLSSRIHLFTPADRNIQVDTLEDVKQYKVAVTRETASHHFLLSQGFVEGKNLILLNKEKQISLMAGASFRDVDFSPRDAWYQAWWEKRTNYPPGYWKRSFLIIEKELYMAFSLKTPRATVVKVRDSMRRLRESGALEKIKRRHMEDLAMPDIAPDATDD